RRAAAPGGLAGRVGVRVGAARLLVAERDIPAFEVVLHLGHAVVDDEDRAVGRRRLIAVGAFRIEHAGRAVAPAVARRRAGQLGHEAAVDADDAGRARPRAAQGDAARAARGALEVDEVFAAAPEVRLLSRRH